MVILEDNRSYIIQMNDELKSLKETNYMLKAIIESIQDAVSVVNNEGNVILVNKAYIKIIGYSPEEVINKPATLDIVKGESVHMNVLKTGKKS